ERPDPSGDHRSTGGHGLERGPARFIRSRAEEDEEIERVQHCREVVVAVAGEQHLLGEPKIADERFEMGAKLPLAYQQKPSVRVAREKERERTDQRFVSPARRETRD